MPDLLDRGTKDRLALLTVKEAREVFGVARSTVYRWIERGWLRRSGQVQGHEEYNHQMVVLLKIRDEELEGLFRTWVAARKKGGDLPPFLANRLPPTERPPLEEEAPAAPAEDGQEGEAPGEEGGGSPPPKGKNREFLQMVEELDRDLSPEARGEGLPGDGETAPVTGEGSPPPEGPRPSRRKEEGRGAPPEEDENEEMWIEVSLDDIDNPLLFDETIELDADFLPSFIEPPTMDPKKGIVTERELEALHEAEEEVAVFHDEAGEAFGGREISEALPDWLDSEDQASREAPEEDLPPEEEDLPGPESPEEEETEEEETEEGSEDGPVPEEAGSPSGPGSPEPGADLPPAGTDPRILEECLREIRSTLEEVKEEVKGIQDPSLPSSAETEGMVDSLQTVAQETRETLELLSAYGRRLQESVRGTGPGKPDRLSQVLLATGLGILATTWGLGLYLKNQGAGLSLWILIVLNLFICLTLIVFRRLAPREKG